MKNETLGIKRKGLYFLILFFIFILVLTFFFGDNGIIEIVGSRKRIDSLKRDIAKLEAKKESLIKEISELKKNPLKLEKRAKEKLWLMKKNEKVVVLMKNKSTDNKK